MARKSKLDIPGFLFDDKTGRYFRQTSDLSCQKIINKLVSDKNTSYRKPKVMESLKLLKCREEGKLSNVHFALNYFKTKVQKKYCVADRLLHLCNADFNYLTFIRCGKRSVYGVWDASHSFTIGTLPLMPYSVMLQNLTASYYNVIDLCETSYNCISVAFNCPRSGNGILEMKNIDEDGNNSVVHKHCKSPVFCCSSNSDNNTSIVVVGCDKFINLHKDFIQSYLLHVKERILSIELDYNNHHIFYGSSNGILGVIDTRSGRKELYEKVSCKYLSNMKLKTSEQLVLSSGEQKLLLYDIRMKKTTCEYFDHISSLKKHHISVTEDLICSSDGDNTVRLWHVSGGLPIEEFKPRYGSNLRGCVTNSSDKAILYLFEENKKLIYEI